MTHENSSHNVARYLETHAIQHPDKVAFYYIPDAHRASGSLEHASMTYAAFNHDVAHVSGGLQTAGIHRGDRVLILLPISPELYIAIASLQRMGAVPVLLDTWSRKEQLIEILGNAKPQALITRVDWLNVLGALMSQIPLHIVTPGEVEIPHALPFHALLQGPETPIEPVSPDDTALITYTTGSSGTPKGADRTHQFLMAQHETLKRLFPYASSDIDLPVFPVFALNNIASGITTVIPAIDLGHPAPTDAQTLFAQIQACQVNTMTLSPTSFRLLAAFCHDSKVTLSSITRVLTGGAPISETDIQEFITIAPHSTNWILYGSTEVEPIAFIESQEMLSILPPPSTNTTKIGVNVGHIDTHLRAALIKIETDSVCQGIAIDTVEVAHGEIGELVVAGEHVCAGYIENEEAFLRTKIQDDQGTVWHRTGDLARLDPNGYLWIVGRKHNAIKRGTEWYFPVRPEIILKDFPLVTNAAYLSLEDTDQSDIYAVLTISTKETVDQDACRAQVISAFAREQIPVDNIVFLDDIPMDVRHHSKVDYHVLRQRLYAHLS